MKVWYRVPISLLVAVDNDDDETEAINDALLALIHQPDVVGMERQKDEDGQPIQELAYAPSLDGQGGSDDG